MEQLLLHLIGDYITQTDWMARKKLESLLAVWLLIAVDNTTHLAINYAALRWL